MAVRERRGSRILNRGRQPAGLRHGDVDPGWGEPGLGCATRGHHAVVGGGAAARKSPRQRSRSRRQGQGRDGPPAPQRARAAGPTPHEWLRFPRAHIPA